MHTTTTHVVVSDDEAATVPLPGWTRLAFRFLSQVPMSTERRGEWRALIESENVGAIRDAAIRDIMAMQIVDEEYGDEGDEENRAAWETAARLILACGRVLNVSHMTTRAA